MSETTNPETVTLGANGMTVTVDLRTLVQAIDPRLGKYHYNPDADDFEQYDEASLFSLIIDAAAGMIAKEVRKDVKASIETAVHTTVMAEVGTLVREALENGTLQRTNEWGGKVGDAKPLKEIIIETASEALTKPVGDQYSRGGRVTVVQKIINDAVGAAFQKELNAVVEQARQQTINAVRDKAAEVITETVKRATRGL